MTEQHPDMSNLDSLLGRWRYLPRFIGLLWKAGRWEMSVMVTVSAFAGAVPVGIVILLKSLVDSTVLLITGEGDLMSALLWVAAFAAMNLLENVVREAEEWLRVNLREQLAARVEEQLLVKAGSLSLAAFERPDHYDQLHRAGRALDERVFTSIDHLLRLASVSVMGIGALAYLTTAHPVYPIVLIAGFIPFHWATLSVYRKVWILTRVQTEAERVLEYLSGLMTQRPAAAEVRLFRLGGYLGERRQALALRLRLERLNIAREHFNKAAAMNGGEQFAYAVVIAGVLTQVVRGTLTIGHFAAYLAATERFREAISLAGSSLMRVDADLRYLADLIDYLEIDEARDVEPTDNPGSNVSEPRSLGTLPSRDTSAITFSGVSFAYPGTDTLALDNLDLVISPGERVALVGRNGAGKTTLAKVILGLYRPTAGSLHLNGADVEDVEPTEWRKAVAAVFQDYFRFELSARDNISFGDLRRAGDEASVVSAAIKSNAHEFIADLPSQYETILGRAFDENGQDISAGQWQRLASARGYFRDASVIVLDEPTAALDPKAEVEVYRRFQDMSEGKSVLLISHRLGSARLADRIVFIDKGRITEEGTHDQLMASGGQYAHMYTVQSAWYK